MIGKLIATTILLLLAFYAFWGNALGAGYLLNPFGILFLFLAAVTWFKWEAVREAFRPTNRTLKNSVLAKRNVGSSKVTLA